MNFFRKLFSSTPAVDLKSIIEAGAFLVDVRTPAEFASGSVKACVNIPLDGIPNQLAKFKSKKNIIVFCRSGARSSQARSVLIKNGLSNVFNGGSWQQVSKFVK
jgi:phage shock protein E